MKFEKGCTRWVFLVGAYALKIPRLDDWMQFLTGMICNMTERNWSPSDTRLAKVFFCCPGGWFLVMERCAPIADEIKWVDEMMNGWQDGLSVLDCDLDLKPANFGQRKDGTLVLLDYGFS